MNDPPANRDPDGLAPFLLMGTDSVFSRAILEGLTRAGLPPAAVLVAGEGGRAPICSAPGPGLYEMARRAALPARRCGAEESEQAIHLARQCQAIVVACWPRRLPGTVLNAVPWGVLNLHPSWLPEFRGPAPLFWQLRAGVSSLAMTVHRMSEELDRGPILAQNRRPRPPGLEGPALDRLLAALGLPLLLETLDALSSGRQPARPQAEGGSYQGWPEAKDFRVPVAWSLLRAWDFMRGSAEWGVPFVIEVGGSRLRTGAPSRLVPGRRVPGGWRWGEEGIEVAFEGGALLFDPSRVRVAPA